jgi:hypothetical protein
LATLLQIGLPREADLTPQDPSRRLLNIFKEVDWLIPAYMTGGFIRKFAIAIEKTPIDQRHALMRSILSQIYSPYYLSAMYLERYSKINHTRNYSRQIGESIKAYYSGYKYVAIISMIPTLEGILRKFAAKQQRDIGHGTQKLHIEFDKLVEKEENSPHRYEERLAMFEGLRDFMRDRFLKDTRKYNGLDELNRHGILHGIFEKYDDDMNFFRMITLLDLVCFSISVVEGGSGFAAEDTPYSKKLAAHYLILWKRSQTDGAVP